MITFFESWVIAIANNDGESPSPILFHQCMSIYIFICRGNLRESSCKWAIEWIHHARWSGSLAAKYLPCMEFNLKQLTPAIRIEFEAPKRLHILRTSVMLCLLKYLLLFCVQQFARLKKRLYEHLAQDPSAQHNWRAFFNAKTITSNKFMDLMT